MAIQISLSDDIAEYILSCAEARGISPDQFVSDIVTQVLKAETVLPLEQLVVQIQNMPANPTSIRPAQGSLLEALQAGPSDSYFDQEAWDQEWARAEAEMKTATRANDVAEGRG